MGLRCRFTRLSGSMRLPSFDKNSGSSTFRPSTNIFNRSASCGERAAPRALPFFGTFSNPFFETERLTVMARFTKDGAQAPSHRDLSETLTTTDHENHKDQSRITTNRIVEMN